MPALQMVFGQMNSLFGEPEIRKTAQRAALFGPGKRLSSAARALEILPQGQAPRRLWLSVLDGLPPAVHETIRAVVYSALSTRPRPVPITFAWVPGYDTSVTVWQAPDTRLTRGGITMLLSTRYPDDKHPLRR
jgi:hypothetical protein